ncbi:U3 small nucleolar RNA-associated protein 10 [Fulvia fulva]|uniref:U3 small nucleolar RNA-associated protein 10 n=1 Tax=Passalora fulva TaxID=5499 RepID=A0A9Q8LBK0_PASFU|nr:U3 small nucleolar RNA-associated protein 10 [Fulvia fulva]KAK4633704.1 U3 small nucleolar RNA-associated protein 10 [Fulvia fulva]UJO14229.1 U3 small nucleolar RNA-associated protein 10 [Fulvia fulva]WPV11108.1 U3 small nucleolar RNA-associated protein 10 [Fulvia fulva]
MATVLQQQLAAIAARSTHQLDLKAQKARHSKSLLFEARDAAAQNFDTIYQVCLEGFDALCQLDVRFAPFAPSLFSEQSKNEDRATMTAQENAELDAVIESFLRLLGARLLLKPAMKAAEWLVRRFRVHEHNTEALLLTFLPYHASHIFPTLLSILPEQLPPTFRFLHPYVSSLQTPPRHAIVAAASINSAFFAAFSQYTLNLAKARYQSALLLGFWASITAQSVNVMIDATRSGRETARRQKEEDLLLKVLPILQSALSIRGVPELYLGACMIMTILATKSSLSDKALNAMMDAVANGWTDQTVQDGILCLAVLAEEREAMSLPRPVVKAITKHDDLLEIIERIGAKYRVEKLLVGAAIGALHAKLQEHEPRMLSLLTASVLNHNVSDAGKLDVLQSILDAVATTEHGVELRSELLKMLNSLAEGENGSRLIRAAAERADINPARLDADLALQLQSSDSAEASDDDTDAMLLDEQPAAAIDRSALDLTALPKLPSKQTSFLDPVHQQALEQFSMAFHQALPSEEDISALLAQPSLERSACTKQPNTFTFFAGVWMSHAPVSARVKSLQMTAELLQQAKKDNAFVDVQALIPYLIAALADPAKAVRTAAGVASKALHALYKLRPQEKGKTDESAVWSKDTIYGKQSSQVQWLPTADAHRVLADALLPIIEDCVIDAEKIVQSLSTELNGTSGTATPQRKELKATLRPATYAFLASHVVATPSHMLKLRLLPILSRVGKHAGTARSHILLPYVRSVVSLEQSGDDSDNLARALVACVSHRSGEEVQFLQELATSGSRRSQLAFSRLRQLLRKAAQPKLVDWLLDLAHDPDASDDVQSEAVDTLRSLGLPTDVLVHLVETLPNAADLQSQPTPAKKQRTSRTSDVHKLGSVDKGKLNLALRRMTLVLELVEQAKPERHPQLLKGLFHLLSELHHYKALLDSELIYLQGLIVNNLLSVVNGLKANANRDVDRSVIRADLIVDCVRNTSNTQVHHAALLLMSALASWAPDLVLHSVMPLFTFMSSTILKQGDEYSAHVTDQTVARIIPPLAASLKKRGKDLISGAADLLLSFTAAYEHIPLHRRADLFRNLVNTLGADQALFTIAAMLIERHPEDPGVRRFVSELMNTFPSNTQITAVKQYIDLVFDTLKARRALSDVILGYGEKNKEQAKESTSVLIDGLTDVLGRDALRKRLAKELKTSDDKAESLRVAYSTILEKTMQLGLQLRSNVDLRDNAADLLTAVLGLMPTKDFIESSAKLMQSGTDDIRQQVFRSLEQRVVTARRGDPAMQQIFIDVLPNCAVFVIPSQPVEVRVAAIACIDRISDKFGKTDRTTVLQVAQQIVGDAALGSDDSKLRRLSLLCLASMVEVLGDEFVPVLPRTLDRAISYMEQILEDGDEDKHSTGLMSAGFSFAMGILDHVPWLLAGAHLDRLFVVAADYDETEAIEFTALAARKLPAHDCLGTIERTWEQIVVLGGSAARLYLETLQGAVKHHTKSTILKNAQLLFGVLFHAFDLRRRLLPTADEPSHYDGLFELVDSVTMDTVLKLNDATFRPFFLRLGEWVGQIPDDREGTIHRHTSLYSFASTLFNQLKSLVTSYYAFILENSVSLLNSLSPQKELEGRLLRLVIECLTANLSHDQDGFWQTPAHFDPIVEPLLCLLLQAGSLNVEEYVIPAIVELGVAANSPEQHKTLNTMIMASMRHEEAAVRLAAVKVERALTERLNVDWVGHLPEWLPLISELQEDDDGPVERETLRWMKQIEDVTGEDLNSMLQ